MSHADPVRPSFSPNPGNELVFENDRVRVWAMTLEARVTQEAERGFAFFRTVGRDGPLPPHRMRNLEDHKVTHYIVELISEESPSAGPLPHQTNGRGRTSRPTA